MGFKDLFMVDPNSSLGNFAGGLPAGLEYTDSCSKCGKTFKKINLDSYGMCTKCRTEEDEAIDRMMEKLGFEERVKREITYDQAENAQWKWNF